MDNRQVTPDRVDEAINTLSRSGRLRTWLDKYRRNIYAEGRGSTASAIPFWECCWPPYLTSSEFVQICHVSSAAGARPSRDATLNHQIRPRWLPAVPEKSQQTSPQTCNVAGAGNEISRSVGSKCISKRLVALIHLLLVAWYGRSCCLIQWFIFSLLIPVLECS